jgi:class 3 adenylate cyclase
MDTSELARRVGVSTEFVERLVELGIVQPDTEGSFSRGDLFRVRLMRSSDRAGLPLEGIAQAVGGGRFTLSFLDMPHYRWSTLYGKTFADLAQESGIPVDYLLNIEESQGRERPDPTDDVRQDIVDLIPLLREAIDAGLDEKVIARTVRIYADSLRRVAETEGSVYTTFFQRPLLRAGLSYGEAAEKSNALGARMTELQEQMILGMYRRQQELVWTGNTIVLMESVLEEMELYQPSAHPPAMAFLDLSGFTRLTEDQGDEVAAEFAGELGGITEHCAFENGGRPVKWLGDGVMFFFPEPQSAVHATLTMVQRVPDAGLPLPHAGIAAGPVIIQDGDYFGRTVNIAARLAAHASGGQVLVTDELTRLVGDGSVSFRDLGTMELKGIERPVRVHQPVVLAG